MAAAVQAQETATPTAAGNAPMLRNGLFNHVDVAFNAGLMGLGFDIAAPVTDWARLRVGGSFALHREYNATLTNEIGQNTSEEVQAERFSKLSSLTKALMNTEPARTVEIGGTRKMNNFKFLVDIYPFKNNRHWRFTVGFYYGNKTLEDLENTIGSITTLTAMSTYNKMYDLSKSGEFMNMTELGIELDDEMKAKIADKLHSWGQYNDANGNTAYAEYGMSIPIGTYAHDIIATQDIYDSNGQLLHHAGDVIRKTDETARLTPDNDDMIRAEVTVNRFKPYLGAGYDFAVSKDKRSTIGIEAGVIFWGGKPKFNLSMPVGYDANGKVITQTVNLARDVNNIPGDLADHVKSYSNLPVYPEVSIRFARRLW